MAVDSLFSAKTKRSWPPTLTRLETKETPSDMVDSWSPGWGTGSDSPTSESESSLSKVTRPSPSTSSTRTSKNSAYAASCGLMRCVDQPTNTMSSCAREIGPTRWPMLSSARRAS